MTRRFQPPPADEPQRSVRWLLTAIELAVALEAAADWCEREAARPGVKKTLAKSHSDLAATMRQYAADLRLDAAESGAESKRLDPPVQWDDKSLRSSAILALVAHGRFQRHAPRPKTGPGSPKALVKKMLPRKQSKSDRLARLKGRWLGKGT